MKDRLQEIQEKIGYRFNNIKYLEEAMTHRSFSVNHNNQRLEFLGDSILGAAVAIYLYRRPEKLSEGKMTKTRAALIRESTLSDAMRKLDIAKYLKMSKGEDLDNGSEKDSILADLFESIVAAIFLDGEYEQARGFIERNIAPFCDAALENRLIVDYKTNLQERIQKTRSSDIIKYTLLRSEGKDHVRLFTSGVFIGGILYGEGQGTSKKKSEQMAAKLALRKLGEDNASE